MNREWQLVGNSTPYTESSSSSSWEWEVTGETQSGVPSVDSSVSYSQQSGVPSVHSSVSYSRQSGVPSVDNSMSYSQQSGVLSVTSSLSGSQQSGMASVVDTGEIHTMHGGVPRAMPSADIEALHWTRVTLAVEAWMTLPLPPLACGTPRRSYIQFTWTHLKPNMRERPAHIRLWKTSGVPNLHTVQYCAEGGVWTIEHGTWMMLENRALRIRFKHNADPTKPLVQHDLYQLVMKGAPQTWWCRKLENGSNHNITIVLCENAGKWKDEVRVMLAAVGFVDFPPALDTYLR